MIGHRPLEELTQDVSSERRTRVATKATGLLVSFWDICLGNLPEGAFVHRRITPDSARAHIEQARAAGTLLCLTEKDLLAPYGKDARNRHEELCTVLARQFGITLSLPDFCSRHDDEDGALYFINALDLAEIGPDRRLLVITCAYGLPPRELENAGMLDFLIEPSSVEFHLIEAVQGHD